MSVFIGKRSVRKVKVDGRYSVSEDGLVWSGELPLEPIEGVGVNLHGKRVKIAYLVARAFVPNGECRRYVRHKDGDVRNNAAENLEWSDEPEEGKRGRRPAVRWIKAWKVSGELAGCWGSVREAARETGAKEAAIRACLYGRQKFAGGFMWRNA